MRIKRYRKSVFVVVYAKTDQGFNYLLLKRKLHWNGWEFPKRGIKPLETRKNAVKREMLEETGQSPIRIIKFKEHGKYKFPNPLKDRQQYTGQAYTLFAAEIKNKNIKIDKKEHNGFMWADFKKAVKMLKWPNQKKSLKIVNSWLSRK